MYLRRNRQIKDGKEHCYWNIVESKRCSGGKVVQRQVLDLGEINDSQREAWRRVIEAFDEGTQRRPSGAVSGRSLDSDDARAMAFRCGWIGCNGIGHGNGAPVGWPARSTGNSGLTSSRRVQTRARARVARYSSDAGVLPADRSGQRVAAAPAVVRAERNGDLRADYREERALSLPG